MTQYKLLRFAEKDISELDLDECGRQGFRVISVSWNESGAMIAALLERKSPTDQELNITVMQ